MIYYKINKMKQYKIKQNKIKLTKRRTQQITL